KTGTLTSAQANTVSFHSASNPLPGCEILNNPECRWVHSLTRHSLHPHSVRIAEYVFGLCTAHDGDRPTPILSANGEIEGFIEEAGQGISGRVQGHELRLGSRSWLERCGISVPHCPGLCGSTSFLAIDGQFRGTFALANSLRPEVERLLNDLSHTNEL